MTNPKPPISLPEEDHLAIHEFNRYLYQCETKEDVRQYLLNTILPWLHCDTVALGWLNIDFMAKKLEVHDLLDCVGMPEREFESIFKLAPYFKRLTELIMTTVRPVISTDIDIPRETVSRELNLFLDDHPEYIQNDFMVKDFRAGAAVLQRPHTGFVIGFNRFAPNERLFTLREVRQMELLRYSLLHAIKAVSLNDELQTYKALVETMAEAEVPLALIQKDHRIVFTNSAFRQLIPLDPGRLIPRDLAEMVEQESRYVKADPSPQVPEPRMVFYTLPQGSTFRVGLTHLNRPHNEADRCFLIRLHSTEDPLTRLSLDLQNAGLTPREMEIVILVKDGFDDEEIAERLFISVNTVRNHLKAIHKKLNVQSRQKLMAFLHSQN